MCARVLIRVFHFFCLLFVPFVCVLIGLFQLLCPFALSVCVCDVFVGLLVGLFVCVFVCLCFLVSPACSCVCRVHRQLRVHGVQMQLRTGCTGYLVDL